MIRHRLGAVLALVATMTLAGAADQARAAAEVHRLNLTLSVIPSQIDGGDFNKTIDFINRTGLRPNGLESLDKVTLGFLFDAELRYFVRPNFAVSAGLGQLRGKTTREYLPQLQQSIVLTGEVLTVPVHVGGTYYLQAYNQGDFQARAFFSGGVLSSVYNKARFTQVANFPGPQPLHTDLTQDAPGWYGEFGVHMFFAARYSVILSADYHSIVVRDMRNTIDGTPAYNFQGKPFSLDMSGIGARLGITLGL